MLLKALFSAARDLTPDQARAFMDTRRTDQYILLDVRQPGEYARRHIPGARLIPLPELADRLGELDPQKPVIAYCALGGRSRAAAEMLAQRGFREVYSLKGGIKAWDGLTAAGPAEEGLGLVTGREDRGQMLMIAYGLEAGLAAFYAALAPRAGDGQAQRLCRDLAGIEARHQDAIWRLYLAGEDAAPDREAFARQAGAAVMEGGEPVAEALDRRLAAGFGPAGLLGEAMALEAQALDLYLRFAQKLREGQARAALYDLAQAEKDHLKALGKLLDKLAQPSQK